MLSPLGVKALGITGVFKTVTIILLLAMILFIWQVPHSLIIAIRYKSDYEKVGMKQLPIVSGDETAYRHIYLNLLLLLALAIMPYFFGIFSNVSYLIVILVLHFWLINSFRTYIKNKENEKLIKFYRHLMIYLPTLLTIIIVYNQLSQWSFHFQNWF